MSANTLLRQAELLVGQVAHWSPARWRGHGDAVFELVQRLADAGADAEGRARMRVPRLADTALPDQLRVMVTDLVAAGPSADVLTRVAEDIQRTRTSVLGG
jgi:hypothetical protein